MRVSRESAGEIQPLRPLPGSQRWKAPDSQDVVSLRGRAEERESWSVRLGLHGARSQVGQRTGDNRCPLGE